MSEPRVFADFHNADLQGRVRLNCIGTMRDLARQKILLQEGLPIRIYSEDVEADGVVQFSTEEKIWVAAIDWNLIQQRNDSLAAKRPV
jgi:hypothetical protein